MSKMKDVFTDPILPEDEEGVLAITLGSGNWVTIGTARVYLKAIGGGQARLIVVADKSVSVVRSDCRASGPKEER